MKKFIKYLLVIPAVISFAFFMPSFFSIITVTKPLNPVVYYSDVIEDFTFLLKDKNGNFIYSDRAGNTYTAQEFKEINPMVYYRDLQKVSKYNEVVGRHFIPFDDVFKTWDIMGARGDAIDAERIRLKLFPLFETESDEAKLTMPDELFRITSSMEFINGYTKEIDKEKSKLFTDALLEKGFHFPAKIIAGNPDVRKSFDYGYFLLDSSNNLYRLYQAKSKPVVMKINNTISENIIYISILEKQYAAYYGFIITENGRLYFIMKKGGLLQEIPISTYNPLQDQLKIMVNPVSISVAVSNKDKESIVVSNSSYEKQAEYSRNINKRISPFFEKLGSIIFPFTIYADRLTAAKDIKIMFSSNLLAALGLSIIFMFIYLFIFRKNKKDKNILILDCIFILIGGIYSFTALILLKEFKGDNLWV